MNLPKTTLMLRAHLLSIDGGRTWVVSRQYFLRDMKTNQFLNNELEGLRLAVIEEDDHGDASKSGD